MTAIQSTYSTDLVSPDVFWLQCLFKMHVIFLLYILQVFFEIDLTIIWEQKLFDVKGKFFLSVGE